MDVDTLIEFLKMKGKFMPAEDGFTVDITKVCKHWRVDGIRQSCFRG